MDTKKRIAGLRVDPRSLVVMSKAREIQAFFCAMSMEPSQALAIRSKAMRLPPSSTTATFMGWPSSSAFFSAAAMMRRASRVGS
jgi:hypothetical protein